MNNQKKNWLLRIAILCTGFPDIGAGSATPAIAVISQAMPHVPLGTVQMITTIPSLCLIIFTPLYARVARSISKKTLIVISFLFMIVGGIGPAFMDDIYLILCMRFLMGISGAIIMPVTVDLIVELIERPAKNTMLGYSSAVTSIGGIVFQTVGGYLGNIDWHYCFLSGIIAIPFYLFAIIFLPKGSANAERKNGEGPSFFKQIGEITPKLWILGIFMTLWEMLYFVFLTTVSVLLVGEKIANTAQVGVITSMVTVGGLLMSFFYGRLQKVFKIKILPLAYVVTTLGFILLSFTYSAIIAGIGALFIGFGYGTSAPCQLSLANSMVPSDAKSIASSLCYMARGIGGFISVFVFTRIASLTGTEVGRSSFVIAAGTLVILTVFVSWYCLGRNFSVDVLEK